MSFWSYRQEWRRSDKNLPHWLWIYRGLVIVVISYYFCLILQVIMQITGNCKFNGVIDRNI
jgi:hypothetical protein